MITITEETYAKIKRLATGEAFSNESWGEQITPEVKERIAYAREIVEEIENKKDTDWIVHDGKGMPVDGETFVICRFRSGYEENEIHASLARVWDSPLPLLSRWVHSGYGGDIIAYKVFAE